MKANKNAVYKIFIKKALLTKRSVTTVNIDLCVIYNDLILNIN